MIWSAVRMKRKLNVSSDRICVIRDCILNHSLFGYSPRFEGFQPRRMFTVFHTADWHLGQSFFGFDRNFEHGEFFSWLLSALDEHQPDALIIAGDIFDTINPSAASSKLLYNFLADTRQALPQLHIVITAGNHDSGSRLEAPAELLKSLRINVVGTVAQHSDSDADISRFLVPLHDANHRLQALILAIPFLRPSEVPRVAGAKDMYLDGICELYNRAADAAEFQRQAREIPIIAMGHCHLQGGMESTESERPLVIGGAEALNPETFADGFDYVALGHLHKCQKFRDETVCYSGSPFPLSFSERDYEHRVLKVQFEGRQLRAVEDLPVPVAMPMLTVPAKGSATLSEILPLLEELPLAETSRKDRWPFLEVRVLEDGPDPLRRRRIEDVLADRAVRLASIKLEHAKPSAESLDEATPRMTLSDLQSIDPEKVFTRAYADKYGEDPDIELVRAFREIVSQEALEA